jgi:hypothetical protein
VDELAEYVAVDVDVSGSSSQCNNTFGSLVERSWKEPEKAVNFSQVEIKLVNVTIFSP